jgi:hypothetical protein
LSVKFIIQLVKKFLTFYGTWSFIAVFMTEFASRSCPELHESN